MDKFSSYFVLHTVQTRTTFLISEMRSSIFGVIQRCRSMALLRTLSLHYVDRLPTFVFSPRGRFASRRAAALPDDQVPDQGQDQSEDLAAARRWLAKLDPQTVPRHLCEIAFSRSGGPGGQNVNKCVSSLGLMFAIFAIFAIFASRLIIE